MNPIRRRRYRSRTGASMIEMALSTAIVCLVCFTAIRTLGLGVNAALMEGGGSISSGRDQGGLAPMDGGGGGGAPPPPPGTPGPDGDDGSDKK